MSQNPEKPERYANADLKIYQCLRHHMKIICPRFHIKAPFTFWDMRSKSCEKFEKFANFKGKYLENNYDEKCKHLRVLFLYEHKHMGRFALGSALGHL